MLKEGDWVIKNPKNWVAGPYDGNIRGEGIGIVSHAERKDGLVVIKWNGSDYNEMSSWLISLKEIIKNRNKKLKKII